MKITGIFEIVPNSLYSVQFGGGPDHEFSKTFRLWRDMTYLEWFFESNYEDLLRFWGYMSIEEAVKVTKAEAYKLNGTLLTAASAGTRGDSANLSAIFRPLHPATWRLDDFEKSKARGLRKHSWLRIYAIRLGVNRFVITGGAIKLTRTMNEREHLNEELKKLEEVCSFLKGDQKDEFGLFELF
ncbi:MAG: hypothetical protein J7619_19700 [Dyadobacter sp.]|uniref:hypothetical protein n=1 Tax=Dyadobacter sp. TaxID=1914288 RepID=UPI001B2A0D52|nr:hypothetical protein [Dyadobacter sp.]MBO9614938.1 hypothetical protein [Dyadobacter sp.]